MHLVNIKRVSVTLFPISGCVPLPVNALPEREKSVDEGIFNTKNHIKPTKIQKVNHENKGQRENNYPDMTEYKIVAQCSRNIHCKFTPERASFTHSKWLKKQW